ncbi:MAG: sigma-70 family RNA polymerase sigma factor [Steroidobacteraceae bacterium]|jgi:RNA polymerase sigma factor for flagellar operon FliA
MSGLDAINELDLEACAREFMPRIRKLAWRLKWRLPTQVDAEDLLQFGLLGLLQAAQRYRGTRSGFWYFALPRIRGAMLDGLRAADTAPRHLRRNIRQLLRSAGKLEQILGRPVTGREIAAEAGVSLTKYHRMLFEHSVHEAVEIRSEAELWSHTCAAISTDPLQPLLDHCIRRQLRDAITRLCLRDRTLLRLRLDESLELRRIAAIMGVSESRVSQLFGAIAARLRSTLAKIDSGNVRREPGIRT